MDCVFKTLCSKLLATLADHQYLPCTPDSLPNDLHMSCKGLAHAALIIKTGGNYMYFFRSSDLNQKFLHPRQW